MKGRHRLIFLAAFSAVPFAAVPWQVDAPPPAIGQDGVVNSASLMPPGLGGGQIARGSLFRIGGWRLGPEAMVRAEKFPQATKLAGMSVEIRLGKESVNAFPVSVTANEIEAVLPSNAPLGNAELIVSKDGDPSQPFPVRIVEASFGALSINRLGWGPGEVRNGHAGTEAPANSPDHPARPGETITLMGTGLGAMEGPDNRPPQRRDVRRPMAITAGGKLVTRVGYAGRSACCAGTDELSFDLPADTPEGCYVPLQIQSAPGIASNVVTVSVSRERGPCKDPGNWLPRQLEGVRRAGVAGLLHVDLLLEVERQNASFNFDAGFATFIATPSGPAQVNPFYLFPPYGTCTAYNRIARGGEILSAFTGMTVVRGASMDAGRILNVRGGGDSRSLGFSSVNEKTFAGVLGGRSPFPTASQYPLFLRPQTYEISGGGKEVGSFRASVPVSKVVRWDNRAGVTSIDRHRGVTIEWTPARPDDSIVITAMNVDARTGAFGVCECLVPARARHFTIPVDALTNIPPTRGGDSLPLNLLFVSEFPGQALHPFEAPGLDRGLGFFFSTSARSVEYR